MNSRSSLAAAFMVLAGAAFSVSALAQAPPHNPAMRDACAEDIKSHCADAKPGQPTMQCVMMNRDKMSEKCKGAMAAMRSGGGMGGQGKPEGAPGKPNN